ncbi:ABC transporter permease [Rubellimicrobium mesophilum]|uniref:ABC transporter permease n=1 Tax=Rubellimicrobium mesophilum TaxID=1123067 RepID=UPI0009E89728
MGSSSPSSSGGTSRSVIGRRCWGCAWALLQPLLTATVLTLIFARLAGVATDGVPYPLFVLAGLIPWQFFSHGVSTAATSFVTNQELVRRVYFPRLALPLAAVLSGLIELLVHLPLLVAVLIFYDWVPSVRLLLVWAPLLLGLAATLGVGLILCAANAQYRDVGHALPFALQFALFASPIAYPSSALPGGWRMIYSLNPMVGVVDGLRWSLFGTAIHAPSFAISVASTFVALGMGAVYLRHTERSLADIL